MKLNYRSIGFERITEQVPTHLGIPCHMDGVPMNQIAAMLGDTQKTAEKNYLHLSPDYLRSAVNRDSESYAVTPQIAQVALKIVGS